MASLPLFEPTSTRRTSKAVRACANAGPSDRRLLDCRTFAQVPATAPIAHEGRMALDVRIAIAPSPRAQHAMRIRFAVSVRVQCMVTCEPGERTVRRQGARWIARWCRYYA